MKLWLDDLRSPPEEEWVWVRTVDEAISWLLTKTVTHASLDNDLGEDELEGRKLVLWMAENNIWPREFVAVHSANSVAAEYMAAMIDRYGPFSRIPGTSRFER